MGGFNTKFPAVASALMLIAGVVHDAVKAVKDDESLLAKISEFENLIPMMVAFLPQAGDVSAQIKTFQPADYAAAAEYLVEELGFSSTAAQNVIRAAFPVLDKLVELEPLVMTLVAQVKSGAQPVAAA